MENRFGLKDLILYLLIIALIAVQWLSMVQRDREWPRLIAMQDMLNNQTRDLANIRRQLAEGIAVHSNSGPTTRADANPADPFARVKAAQQMPGYATGDWLVDNFGTKVPTLTPLISSDVYGSIVQARILESLIYRDPYTLEYLPLLARSWQITDNSAQWHAFVDPRVAAGQKLDDILHDPNLPPALEITFQLRAGVTFSDGVPMTADDVLFTYNWIMNPRVNAPRERAYYDKILAVEKVGDLEVRFQFREPYFESFALAGGLSIMPRHFYEQYTPEQFNESPGLLLGTGPYRLKDPTSWRPGAQIEVVRNERYWGEPSSFDRLVWYQVENDAASMTMFKNGEVDLFGATPEQYRILLADKPLMERAQSFEFESPVAGYTYIAWNQKQAGQPTRFADRRVRLAMTLLTDRQRIIDELFLGYGKVATGPFSRLGKQADPQIEPWPFDPQRAMALLKEAGYADRNGDGILEGPDNQPFIFKLSYPSGSELYQRIVLFLKDTYARAGVSLVPDPQDWPVIIKKLNQRDFDAISLAWTGSVEGDIYQMFHSEQIKDQGDNFMSYANPELDRLIAQARTTLDEENRLPLWRQAHQIIHEDQPYTFLITRTSLAFIDKRIHNVERTRLGLNYAQRETMPVPWFVPADQQKWSR